MNEEFEAVVEASSLHPVDKVKLINLMRLVIKPYWTMTPDERIAARLASGLSKGQARRLLEMSSLDFGTLESSQDITKFFSPAQLAKVDDVFGTGQTTGGG